MLTPYLTCGMLLLLVAQEATIANNPQLPLSDLVHTYMQTDDQSQRVDIAKQIERDQSYTPQRLDGAIRHVQLWPSLRQREGQLVWTDRRSQQQTTSYRLPVHYDPAQSYPLILGDVPTWFGDPDAFVVASLPADLPYSFHQSPDDHAGFFAMLLALRRSIHLDTQRTFLCAPADVGWLLLSAHADIFSAAILQGSPLKLPYATQLYPILLENYQNTPIRWVMPIDQVKTASQLGLYLQYLARQKNVPIEFINLDQDQTKLSLKSSKWLASLTKPAASRPTSHWYRFPSQGRTPWLHAIKYKGKPWIADQLSIVVNPTVDRATYITGVLKDRLAYLGGRVTGQSIEIETRRCEHLVWRLYEHSIDWSKPITVLCNGQRRFEGPIKPSITTMLESARASWNFSRPVWVSRTISIRSDAPDS